MSELDDQFVKRGFWINWSEGPVMGRTITTNARAGGIIIVLLTIAASTAIAQLWQLAIFYLHQIRANGRLSDGLFWQQQALLRTLPTPTSLMTDTTKLWWTWRPARRTFARSWWLILFALFFITGSLAASILSSYIVSTTDLLVLVNSPSCSNYDFKNASWSIWETLGPVVKSYAMDCYQPRLFLPKQCHGTYTRPNISMAMSSADCPWSPSMCSNSSISAITLDSGYLDIDTHLGFNVQAKDTVKFRKKTTCSILPLEGHYIIVNSTYYDANSPTPHKPGDLSVGLRYGRFPSFVPASKHPEDIFHFSYNHNYLAGKYPIDVQIVRQHQIPDIPQITPLPEMERKDADVVVIALSLDNIMYPSPIDDPLFAAHKLLDFRDSQNFSYYASDNPAGMIGCAMQYEFCISHKGQKQTCTPPSGLPVNFTQEDMPKASQTQLAALNLLTTLAGLNDISNTGTLKYVQAEIAVMDNIGGELPSDQWIKEIVFAESFAYAGLQHMVSEYAVGAKSRDPRADYVVPPTTAGEKALCRAMKMRKPGGFANVNVFGLAFILTFAVVLTLLNTFILRIVIFMGRFRRFLQSRVDRWVQDGVFQLQRRAFDAHGQGTWIHITDEIPRTTEMDNLDGLPLDGRSLSQVDSKPLTQVDSKTLT